MPRGRPRKDSSSNGNFNIKPGATQPSGAASPKLILERMAQGTYLTNPALAAKDQLRLDLDPWQGEVIHTLLRGEKKRVSVRAGHGSGKTFLSATIAHIFLNNYPKSRVLITGPTSRQTRLQVWSYLNEIWQTNFLREKIEWLKTKMYVKGHEENWFAAWVTSKNHKNAEGFHGENLLWIIEEGKSVQDAVYEGVQGALSQVNNFFYTSSTCGHPSGYFYETHTSRTDQWDTFHIPSWKSPRVSPEKIEVWRKEWGEDSPIYQARVAAEFPEESMYSIVPLSHLFRAVEGDDDDEEGINAAA